jgi:hypothetical protein
MKAKTPTVLPPENKIQPIPTDELFLDAKNPRLRGTAEGADQRTLLKLLWTECALDELVLSIAKNGYFPEEPLFAIKEDGRYVVVEGNRRLAAVKILRDPKLRQELRATDIPTLSPDAHEQLNSLPVSVYPDRKRLWTYVGFRHVNGPLTWDSWSKAQYIAQVHNTFGIDLDEIADSIGDKHQTVKRLYRGLMVLNQATEQAGYDIDNRSKKHLAFSHLYTGLDYAGFQQHLGLEKDGGYKPNPIPSKCFPNLKELMIWLYGSQAEEKAPVIKTQNPDLKRLDEVLKNQRALAALRSGLGLDVSYNLSLGETTRLREALTRARYEMQQAKGLILEGYKGERDLLDSAESVWRLAESIYDEMRAYKPKHSGRVRGH